MEQAGCMVPIPGQKFLPHLTVNTNTVFKEIQLSNENMKMTRVTEDQHYPDHPDRFDYWDQLLCREGLTGVCYWEVQWYKCVSIAVSYRGIKRKGSSYEQKFGYNDQSWCLQVDHGICTAIHNKEKLKRFVLNQSDKIGVLLDHPAGTLTFTEVHPFELINIHTFRTTFTEPLYPGFRIWKDYGSSVSLVAPVSS